MRLTVALLAVGGLIAVGRLAVPLLGSSHVAAERSDWSGPTAADSRMVARLERAATQIEDDYPSVVSLLVARHRRLLLEKYFHDFGRDDELDVYSITKSVMSTVVGVAVDRGELKSVDEPVVRFFGSRVRGADPRVARITLRDLLTMRAGFAGDGKAGNGIGDVDDVVAALLHRPLVRPPGTAFAYDTGSFYLLSAAITRATRISAAEYAQRHLFEPLGMAHVDWWRGLHRISSGGTGISATARDLARFGELFLQHGRWHGRRLVSDRWIRQATHPWVTLGGGHGYGFGWWTVRRRGISVYAAVGYGGQLVAVIPKLDAVVVLFSDTAGVPPSNDGVLFARIVPALEAR